MAFKPQSDGDIRSQRKPSVKVSVIVITPAVDLNSEDAIRAVRPQLMFPSLKEDPRSTHLVVKRLSKAGGRSIGPSGTQGFL